MVNLMTEHEVSKRINVSVASLRRWRLLGSGPAFVKVGSLVRYQRRTLPPGSPRCRLVGLPATSNRRPEC
jgi:hypothetical protein